MAIVWKHFIGNYKNISYFNLFREFIFFFQKIILICIISFLNIGTDDIKEQNNAFLCLVFCLISFFLQKYYCPFLTKELNDLNYFSNITMISTIFLGLHASICENEIFQSLLMMILLAFNIVFILFFVNNYIQIQILTSSNSKLCFCLKNFIEKKFPKSLFFKNKIFIIFFSS